MVENLMFISEIVMTRVRSSSLGLFVTRNNNNFVLLTKACVSSGMTSHCGKCKAKWDAVLFLDEYSQMSQRIVVLPSSCTAFVRK